MALKEQTKNLQKKSSSLFLKDLKATRLSLLVKVMQRKMR